MLRVRAVSDWVDRAACAGTDETVFHPHVGSAHGYDEARRLCAGCPVRNECLVDAMTVEGSKGVCERHGLRAGLTPQQRCDRFHRDDNNPNHPARRYAADLADLIGDVVRHTPDVDIDRALRVLLTIALTDRGL